jgi:gas vesicle protein
MAKKPVSYFAGSMIVGTAIGALVAMLVAPKSGRDTRLQIKTRASEAPKYLATQVKELPGRSREAIKALPGKFARRMKGERASEAEIPGTGPLDETAIEPSNQDS